MSKIAIDKDNLLKLYKIYRIIDYNLPDYRLQFTGKSVLKKKSPVNRYRYLPVPQHYKKVWGC
jgi:hypothetical protein